MTEPTPTTGSYAPPVTATVEIATAAQTGAVSIVAPSPRRPVSLVVLGAIGISVLGVIVLVVAAILAASLGPVAFVGAALMALVPLAIVLFGVHLIDRWEPEPRALVAFCFLWGAGFAVLTAIIVGDAVQTVIAAASGSDELVDFLGSIIEAPLVEEGGKGLGLLLILLVARRHFDSAVDGVVYAAWIAAGFAFSENILYFGSQLVDGGVDGELLQVFVIRGLMSPFAHVMFTACIGIALGLAARRTGALGSVGVFLLGMIPAVGLHALWNGALYIVPSFLGYYVLVQVPLFVGAVALVFLLRRQESRLTFARLSEYADAGWFSAGEVTSLATGTGRRQALAWARPRGLGPVMRTYTRDATKLALVRQRIITGRGTSGAAAEESALLGSIVREREVLQAALARDAALRGERRSAG